MQEIDLIPQIENCSECGNPMDVTSFPPFSEVQCPACETNVHVKSDIGGYQITGSQGVGGMSLVFKAVDKTLGRKVAIKLLNESYSSDEKRIEEFEKEAMITAAISHPNVVRVFTVGQAYGRYYIAMELVEGQSLEQKMAVSGKLDEKDMTRLAIEVVEGLKSAHQAGLIHRDMKPGNILIDLNGRAKIVDFGLALVTSGGKALAEEIWATPYYVPPETLKLQEEDLRSDIYALAASLYHALAGDPPFATETKSTTELLEIKTSIPRLSKVASDVSEHMCAIIDKAMSFEADDRFQSYEELLDALRQLDLFYRSGTIPDLLKKEPKPAPRRSRKKALPVAPLAMGVVVVAGVIWYANHPKSEEPVSNGQADIAVEDHSDTLQAQRMLIATELKTAQNLMKKGEYSAARERFLKLALTPGIPQETVFWAGLHAAAASWLDGDSTAARSSLNQVSTQLKQSELEASSSQALRLFEELSGFGDVDIPDNISPSLDSAITYTAALKNWEQGKWERARELFKTIKKDDSLGHKKKASEYLADYRLLEEYRDGVTLSSSAQASEILANLEDLETKLKTRGRAKFNIAQWKSQVQDQQASMALSEKSVQEAQRNAQKDAAQSWDDVERDLEKLVSNHYFKMATTRLKKANPVTDAQKQWQQAMLFFTSNAGKMFETTAQLFRDKSGSFVVRTRQGKNEYDKVLGAESSGLLVSSGDNASEKLRWPKVAPESMWELHKSIPNVNVPEEMRTDRMVQLACYAYLAGLNDEALLLSNKLLESNEEFAQEWKKNVAILEAAKLD